MRYLFLILFTVSLNAQTFLPAFQGVQNKKLAVSYTGYSSTGFEGKTYKTTDSGVNWTEVNSVGYYNLFFINENIGYGVKFESSGLADNTYKTTNGGGSWTKINNKGYRDLFFITENIGYGIRYDQGEGSLGGGYYPTYDEGKTYKTADGGVNWSSVNDTAYYDLFFISETIGYATRLAGEGGSTYKTTNGGVNWSVVNSDGYSNLFFINENVGYGTRGGEAGSTYKTSNGGVNWSVVNIDGYSSLFFINENIGFGTKNEATPLIIAGGGGSKNASGYSRTESIPGQITEWGLGNPSTLPTGSTDSYWSGGGGGSWSSDGLPGEYSAQGGKGWNNYLEGGDGNTSGWGRADGGFGGGGGSTWQGGAGGGYNGGPRVTSYGNYTPGGAGGGSYNAGSSQDNAIGEGSAHGQVVISNGTTYTFTNCSKTGMTGPSQGDCNTAYTGTTLAGLVTLDNGIQLWQVPSTGTYIIEVWGAKGNATSGNGANGARMKGTFSLTNGETLRIAVGQMGEQISNSGGGGGGTFVAKGNTHGGNTYKTTNGGASWTKINDNVYHDFFFIN